MEVLVEEQNYVVLGWVPSVYKSVGIVYWCSHSTLVAVLGTI